MECFCATRIEIWACSRNLDRVVQERNDLDLLITFYGGMSSGYYCDDSDYEAPGNEDIMQNQEEEPNWYRYTLMLPMVTEPGGGSVYYSDPVLYRSQNVLVPRYILQAVDAESD